jgi:probable HAF family extracellular repeat protein
LGTLDGTRSVANGINYAGQVVGETYAAGDFTPHAALWDGTRAMGLGTLGGASSSASAINNSGQIVGWAQSPSGESYATVWNGSTATQLRKVDSDGSSNILYEGGSSARGINDNGQIVGTSGRGAVLWDGTAVSTALPLTSANAINNSGLVVGMSHYSACIPDLDQCFYSYHAPTIWSGSESTDLSTLGTGDGEALATNDAGQITGTSGGRAVLWDHTAPIDLNSFLDASIVSEGWVLTAATGINENGWIVGSAVNNQNNITHAFLLAPVPEPETYAMLLAGLGLICSLTSRRKLQS